MNDSATLRLTDALLDHSSPHWLPVLSSGEPNGWVSHKIETSDTDPGIEIVKDLFRENISASIKYIHDFTLSLY